MIEVSDPTLIVTNDGEIPFKRPQAGQDPVGDQDFVTKGWAVANLSGGGGPTPTGTMEVIDLGDRMTGLASVCLGTRV